MRPLALTGLGIVSPLGVGRAAFFEALADPEQAARQAFEPTTEILLDSLPDAHTAEIWGWDPAHWLGKKGHRSFDRLTKFLIVAAKHALEDAGLKEGGEFLHLSPAEVGICSATAYGSLDAITELNRVAELEDPRYINPTRFPNTVINAAAGYVSIWEDLRAPNTTVVDGNCGSLDAFLGCATHLACGRARAFLVGGGEIVSEPLYLAMHHLGLLRDERGIGLIPSEGASYVVVEPSEQARARGATIAAELLGYGTHFEPPRSEALLAHASSTSVELAILGALGDAGLEPSAIDAISSSQSGLEELDAAEREGIVAALGPDVPILAPKLVLGESFGAAGAFGVASALGWMQGLPMAPRVGGRAPSSPPRHVVVTAVGYYGNVSAIVLRSGDRP
ncbi:MAG: hypothetical protein OEY14_03960 [Myxococcales bacterium]|nr:hypothetical protein [Myxococcales bacterium]